MTRRVLVTGLGVVSGLGWHTDAFWNGLLTGGTGLSAAPASLALHGARVVGLVPERRVPLPLQDPRNARALNRTFEFLLAAGALAAADARLSIAPVAPARLGVTVGIGSIDQFTPDVVDAARQAVVNGRVDLSRFAATASGIYPLRRLRMLPNIGTGLLAIEHQAMGPSLTLVSGHASGMEAIAHGRSMIADGRVDAVLCGGADSRLTPIGIQLFARQSPLSPSDDPQQACRPFDVRRNGVTAAEGAGVVVLEGEDSAGRRGVRVYAELVACASAGPRDGCAQSMRRVMHIAGSRRPDVVVAHGDGGIDTDRVEAQALREISPKWASSVKGIIGHTMSACGAINLATACLILANERVPALRPLTLPEIVLPFPTASISGHLSSALVNVLQPDYAATSAFLVRA